MLCACEGRQEESDHEPRDGREEGNLEVTSYESLSEEGMTWNDVE